MTKLVGGTVITQLLSVLASPIVTRLFGPEAFGLFAIFLSIIGLIVPVVCLRYEFAIVLPRSEQEAAPLVWVCIALAALVALATGPVLFFYRQEIATLFNVPGLSQWILLIPATELAAGIFVALNYWNTRVKRFGRLSAAQVTRSVTMVGTQLGAGFAGFISGGSLIFAAFLGYLSATLMLGGLIWREDGAVLRQGLTRHAMIQGMKRYRNFPLIDTWGALLTSISWELPVILLATFFSTAVVGAYSLCLMVLQIPMNVIGVSLGQVFFSAAAPARHASGDVLVNVIEETEVRLIIIAVLPFMILALAGQELFMSVFGPAWSEAGIYAQILAPWIMIEFLVSPISTLFSVLEIQRYALIQNGAILPMRVGALSIGGALGSPLLALALFSGLGIVSAGVVGVFLIWRAGASVWRIFSRARFFLFFTGPLLVVMVIFMHVFAESPVIIALAAVVVMIPYYWVVLRRDPVVRSVPVGVLKRFGIPVPRWLEP